jgi:hypothetical protein
MLDCSSAFAEIPRIEQPEVSHATYFSRRQRRPASRCQQKL